MKDFIVNILKGMVVGLANIIPGVSGGTIALSMGIYEKIIFAINNIRKDWTLLKSDGIISVTNIITSAIFIAISACSFICFNLSILSHPFYN